MKIVVAGKGGYCFGVRNALELTLGAAEKGSVATYGSLIHNRRTTDMLASLGIEAIASADEAHGRQIVIRSHGAPPEVFASLGAQGAAVIDATCPFVRRIRQRVEQCARQGVPVVMIGDPAHPEVAANQGWAGLDGNAVFVVNSAEDAARLPALEKACVAGQTTYSAERAAELIALIRARIPGAEVFDFICPATSARQEEVRALAAGADAALIVGDAQSANTRELALLAQERCGAAYIISGAEEIPFGAFTDDMTVLVAAGASAPPEAMRETADALREHFGEK